MKLWCIALLVAVLGVNATACTHAPPILQPITSCGSSVVTADNIQRVERDLANLNDGGEADLLAWIVAEGPSFVGCLIDWYSQNGTATQKSAASRFKAGHKAQLAPTALAPPGKGPGLVGVGG